MSAWNQTNRNVDGHASNALAWACSSSWSLRARYVLRLKRKIQSSVARRVYLSHHYRCLCKVFLTPKIGWTSKISSTPRTCPKTGLLPMACTFPTRRTQTVRSLLEAIGNDLPVQNKREWVESTTRESTLRGIEGTMNATPGRQDGFERYCPTGDNAIAINIQRCFWNN